MQLLSHEIAQDWTQLTYTDAGPVDKSKRVLMVRWPHEGPMKRPVLWHQLKVLRAAQDWIDQETRRVRDELEKID